MTLSCHTWQPLGLRFEIFKKKFLAEEMDPVSIWIQISKFLRLMNPLHRKLECRSDISKADLKISYPNSYHDFQLRAKCRKNWSGYRRNVQFILSTWESANSNFFVTSIALICGRVWPQLSQPLARSLIGSPGTLTASGMCCMNTPVPSVHTSVPPARVRPGLSTAPAGTAVTPAAPAHGSPWPCRSGWCRKISVMS